MPPTPSSGSGLRLVAAIVHYGDLQPTIETVESVASNCRSTAIWVIDNQGTGSEGLPCRAARAVDRWLEPGTNLGYGGGIDLAASTALAEGGVDAVLALNNDVELERHTLAELVAELEREPRAAAVTPRVLRADPPHRIWYDGGTIDWRRGSARVPAAGRPAADHPAGEPHDVAFASGCVVLLRLAALAEAGGFDRRYFLYEEDVELSLRLRAAGWRLRHAPAATARHRGQASQRRRGEPFLPLHDPRHPHLERLVELRVSNRLLTASRHAHGIDRLRFCVGFPSYWLAKSLQATLTGRLGVWRALVRGLDRYRRLSRIPPSDRLSPADSRRGL